jgi:hypothetical protein
MDFECRECQSTDVQLFKAKFVNDMIHIFLCCNSCFSRYYYPKTKDAVEAVRFEPLLQGPEIKQNAKEWKLKRRAKFGKKRKFQRVSQDQESLF